MRLAGLPRSIAFFFGFFFAVFLAGAFAQSPDGSLSGLAKIDAAALDSHPTLAEWRGSHASETPVEPTLADPEYETQGQWCAASRASIRLSNDVTVRRTALFYIPNLVGSVPAHVDPSLTGRCELLSFWYQADNPPAPKDFTTAVAQELGEAWGAAEVASRFSRLRHGWGAGYWEPYYHWQLPTRTAVVALDPKGPPEVPAKEPPRVIVILRSAQLPEENAMDVGNSFVPAGQPGIATEAMKLSGLTGQLNTARSVGTFVQASKSLPPARKAAALLAAELAMPALTADLDKPDVLQQLEAAGAKFSIIDGGEFGYTHNWLQEAERLAPAGPTRDLIRMQRLESPCSFEGPADWRAALIPYGEKFLKDSPQSPWTPYVHYILGRAYTTRLLLTYRNGDMGANPNQGALDPVALRDSAIAHYRAFLADQHRGQSVQFASMEGSRLLAGLPPTPLHFGCSD